MEPESSFPYSQKSASIPYSEPDESSPHPPSCFFKIHLNIMLLSASRYYKWSLSLGFPHQTPACLSFLTHACHTSLPYDVTWAMALINVYKIETFWNTKLVTLKKYVINGYGEK
jgi:hypothetical protein